MRNQISLRHRSPTLLACFLLAVSLGLSGDAQTPAGDRSSGAPAPIRVPAGFEVIQVAGSPLVQFPMMAGFDDRGRLFVAESTGLNLTEVELADQLPNLIRLLEDTNGDGVFDKATVFADSMTFPQGALWHEGALYVASPPSIWRLEDTNGDGKADLRTEIVTGFEYTGNAADVHGPFLHPNGRIYWTHGRKGHEVYQKDGTLVSKGLGARIWSSRPDGSDIQVHAGGGMDNPTELIFTQAGDIFGTVPLFERAPRNDAVVHWIHGGAYPHNERAIAEFKRTGDLLPAAAYLGHVAPSGITLLRDDAWGPEYQGNFLLAEFNTRRIMRVIPHPEGSGVRGQVEVFATGLADGMYFTDVLEDADGSLLVIDTGAWFRRGCPTSGIARPDILGAIYRIRPSDPAGRGDDPRGLRIAWDALDPKELASLLGDRRPAVRDRAVDQFARRGSPAVPALNEALGHPDALVRSNAVWSLTRIASAPAADSLRKALRDADPEVRQAAAHAAFFTGDAAAYGELVARLQDSSWAVRREAARALGRLGRSDAIPHLVALAAESAEDPLLSHAAIYALIEIGDSPATANSLEDPDPLARRAALIALDQMDGGHVPQGPVIAAFSAGHPELRRAALDIAARRPEWSPEIARFLDGAFTPPVSSEIYQTARQLLAAFIEKPEVHAWLQRQLSAPSRQTAATRLLLDLLADVPATAWDESWSVPVTEALRSEDPALAEAALRAIAVRPSAAFDSALREIATDPARTPSVRIAALRARSGANRSLDDDAFQLLIAFAAESSPELRLQAASVLGEVRLSPGQLLHLAELLPSFGPLETAPLLAAFRRGPAQPEIAAALIQGLSQSPSRWSLSESELRSLVGRYPEPAFTAALPLLAEIRDQTTAKEARLAELEGIASGGDILRGRNAFLAGKGACISCHRVGDTGGVFGPDLSHIGRIRTQRDLLEAIAFPEATLARGYETYRVETTDGRTLFGTIPNETADTIFLGTGGSEDPIPRSLIRRIEPTTTSLMPPGLERLMEPEELADMIAFLLNLK